MVQLDTVSTGLVYTTEDIYKLGIGPFVWFWRFVFKVVHPSVMCPIWARALRIWIKLVLLTLDTDVHAAL